MLGWLIQIRQVYIKTAHIDYIEFVLNYIEGKKEGRFYI